MAIIEIPPAAKDFIDLLIKKEKDASIITNEEVNEVGRLENKRKDLWVKYTAFETNSKNTGDFTLPYVKQKEKFLVSMEEIDLEVLKRKNDFVKRRNGGKRMKLVDIFLVFANSDIEFIKSEGIAYSFDDLCSMFERMVLTDTIEEKKNEKQYYLNVLLFNKQHQFLTTEDKYYLDEEKQEEMMHLLEEDEKFIKDNESVPVVCDNLNQSTFNLTKLFHNDSSSVLKAIRNVPVNKMSSRGSL